jgi:hypothetical protein
MVSHRLVCFTGLSPMHSMKFKGEPSFLRACALPKKDDFVRKSECGSAGVRFGCLLRPHIQ